MSARICPTCQGKGWVPRWDSSLYPYANCSTCTNGLVFWDLVLHPNVALRDPFGLRTIRSVWAFVHYAEAFAHGWSVAREMDVSRSVPSCGYGDLRDALYRLCDMPPLYPETIALWVTREHFFLSFEIDL
jgi:hypothetical protein